MQRFIPFEDQWDELAALDPSRLLPYHVDVPCERGLSSDQRTVPGSPSMVSVSPSFSPSLPAVPALSSSTYRAY
ncbi:hypothetical protein SAMN05660880_00648 [Luteibacter sp. 22Crub2.1]|nr:hypothetical protein SAMN05660880_00648 [Luteibacter sp. 22Crub2.1]